jgi:hypothetical protein
MSFQSDFTGPQVDASVRDHIDAAKISKDRASVEVDGDAVNAIALTPVIELRPNSVFCVRFCADLSIVDGTGPYENALPTRWLLGKQDVFGPQVAGSGVQPAFQSIATSSGDSELGIATIQALSPTVFGYNFELPLQAPAGESSIAISYDGMLYTGASPEFQIAAVGVVAGNKYRYRITNYYLHIDPVKTVV